MVKTIGSAIALIEADIERREIWLERRRRDVLSGFGRMREAMGFIEEQPQAQAPYASLRRQWDSIDSTLTEMALLAQDIRDLRVSVEVLRGDRTGR